MITPLGGLDLAIISIVALLESQRDYSDHERQVKKDKVIQESVVV